MSLGRRLHPFWIIVLAVGQVISPPLTMAITGRDIGGSGGETPLLNPAGYAFLIWTPIVLGSLAYAVYQALPAQRERGVYPLLRRPVALLFALFTAWIIAALQEWLWVTVLVFAAMLGCLWRIVPVLVRRSTAWSRTEFALVLVPFSLYAGWTTIALFANLAAAVVFYGIGPARADGLAWQVVVLLAAFASALYGVRRTRGEPVYVAALLWALIAILINNLASPGQILAVLAGLAALGVLVAALQVRPRPKPGTQMGPR